VPPSVADVEKNKFHTAPALPSRQSAGSTLILSHRCARPATRGSIIAAEIVRAIYPLEAGKLTDEGGMAMENLLIRMRRGTYAAAVTVALAFGARTALAAPLHPCTDPNSVGTCHSTSDCRKICNRLSNGLIPDCDFQTSCCTCQKL
jgi:hypothetical protein